MTRSSLHREWVSILSKCVYVKFNQIDFFASQDIAKNRYFLVKLADQYVEGAETLRELSEGEKNLIAN